MHPRNWFEMDDILRGSLVGNAWVPIWRSRLVKNELTHGTVGYWEEFTGLNSLVVNPEFWDEMKNLDYSTLSPNQSHRPWKNHGIYNRPMEYVENNVSMGDFLVVQQLFEQDESPILQINQDLILALRLKEENGVWLCPEEGYEPVVRIQHDDGGKEFEVDIRLSFLKDYLSARGCRLLVKEFFQRIEFVPNLDHLPFLTQDERGIERSSDDWRWDCWYHPMDKNGNFVNGGIDVLSMAYVEKEDIGDAPQFSPDCDEMQSKRFFIPPNPEDHVGIFAELRRTEFILPAKNSPRVLLEDEPSLSFIASPDGTTKTAEELKFPPQWLFFRSGIIPTLLEIRNSTLSWFTRDTGAVQCGNNSVHFGVNEIGLISVFAKDIVDLPSWLQSRWKGFNVIPEGGPSRELLASQMYCNPAATKAPESLLPELFERINGWFQSHYGCLMFLEQAFRQELIRSIHRFRVQTKNDIYSLAKDVVRLTTDSINITILRKLLKSKGKTESDLKNIGSNKLLESFWLQFNPAAAQMISPLFFLYDMRLGDSHPLAEKSKMAAKKLGLNADIPLVKQGELIIKAVVNVLSLFYQSLLDMPSGFLGGFQANQNTAESSDEPR
ncbi:MAG: hypothetical protein IJK04_00590 [Kiritimatiellae bacterium]|nr:hypothetical protein [Kiritimatiellia bacterium]